MLVEDCSRLVKLYPMLTVSLPYMLLFPAPTFKLLLYICLWLRVCSGNYRCCKFHFWPFHIYCFTVYSRPARRRKKLKKRAREYGNESRAEGISGGNAAWEFIIPLKNNLASKALTYLECYNLLRRWSVWRLTMGVWCFDSLDCSVLIGHLTSLNWQTFFFNRLRKVSCACV